MDLPDDLPLPLVTGEPWWYWLGGRPALDLVNTLRERWQRRVETLCTPEDLSLWCVRAGLVDAPAPIAPALLDEARALREAIDGLALAAIEGRPGDPAALEVIDRLIKVAGTRPQLVPGPDGVPLLVERGPGDSPRRALGVIALDAARMLSEPAERTRIRVCASASCSARFYDRSPAGRRRWCSMRSCGNVEKARRHRARAKA